MKTCSICSSETPTDGILIDGSVFHNRCLEILKKTIDVRKVRERTLLIEFHKRPSFIENISIFFFQSRQAEMLASKQRIASLIQQARKEHDDAAAKVRLVYDLWPTYPPDWGERQRLVNERDDYSCSECGLGDQLQLHHIRALSQGGTNRLDNIALLCEGCHSAAHGGRSFRYEARDATEPTTIERKIVLVNKAIAQRKDVRFRYKKPDGTITHRTVTPRQLRKLSIAELQALIGKRTKIEKEGTLCLFGYCHLRQANRTFAIHRMYKIEF